MDDKYPLENLCSVWTNLVKKADEHKENAFGKTAKECWQFFDDAHDFMYAKDASRTGFSVESIEGVKTRFRMTLNKVAELVQIFGPTMYFQNPYRQVNARATSMSDSVQALLSSNPLMLQQFAIASDQQALGKKVIAELLQTVLNYTPAEFNLKEHSRVAIDEALIKGRGLLWHEMYSPPGSAVSLPRSFYDSVDNLLIDPDAESLEDATWIARRCIKPVYVVEEKYGLKEGSLKDAGKHESMSNAAFVESSKDGTTRRKQGCSSDLIVYYEIWSKCGMGQWLKGGSFGAQIQDDLDDQKEALEQFGRYTYLVVAEGIRYPLNLPPELMELDVEIPENLMAVQSAVQWPVPFYFDSGGNGWPVTELDFHPIPRSAWPQAHMKSGLGELKFLNWCFSFLASHIHSTSRLFLGYDEHLDEKVKEAIDSGDDLTMIPVNSNLNRKLTESVQFLTMPNINSDIWTIIAHVMELFDKRTGLTELVYGMSGRQYRSATEAQVKNEQINIRPDDMAERVESWQSHVSSKEALMLRWFCPPESIAPVFGETFSAEQMQVGPNTLLWAQLVYVPLDYTNPSTVDRVVREFDYRIEAGSIRKPNRERDQANMDQAMQTLFAPMLQHYQMTGDPTQLNAFVKEWAKTRDLDAQPFMFSAPPPPPAMPDPNAMTDPNQMDPNTIPLQQGVA